MAARETHSVRAQSADALRRAGRANRREHRGVRIQQPDPGGHQGGHHRRARPSTGCAEVAVPEVPVIVLDHLTDAQKRAYILADNQLALNAGWDDDLLRAELAALQEEDFNVRLIGFDDEELARLLAAQDAAEGLTDEDAVPELPETPVSTTGDLWILGSHRLLVGDATSQSDVARLMAGDAADLVFTDPPYNVDYEGYTEKRLKIKGDRMSDAEFKQFLAAAFRSYRTFVKPGASMYVCHSSSWQREFQDALEFAGFEVRCQFIWGKNTFAWGFGRYKFQHEPLFYCHVAGEKDAWYGDKSQSTLWNEKKPASEPHSSDRQAGRADRACAAEQQQVGRRRRGSVRRIGYDDDRVRAAQSQGATHGDRSEVRRLHRDGVTRTTPASKPY